MSIFDDALHIPAERLFFEPQRAQHERVLLPLQARMSARFLGAVALATFAALACLCMGTEMALSRGSGHGALVFAVGFLAAAWIPAAIAIVGVRDVLRPAPHLVIDALGVRDGRLGLAPIAWTEVIEAELIASASGINAVRLTLDHDGPARFNPFRIGGWSVDWSRRRRSRTIALMFLDARPHTLAHAMLLLAGRNGAAVELPTVYQT